MVDRRPPVWIKLPAFSTKPAFILADDGYGLTWSRTALTYSQLDNLLGTLRRQPHVRWAYAYLPTSTASLVAVLSPAFAALFGRAVAKNRLSLSSLNAVVVITAVVAIVALDSGSDRGRPA